MVHGSVHADCARCLRELPAASPLAGRLTRMLGLVSEGRRHAMPTACRDGVACRLSGLAPKSCHIGSAVSNTKAKLFQ